MAAKVDFKKSSDGFRARVGEFRILDIPKRTYLMIDGRGDPNTSVFGEAVSALYPVAYSLKFRSKRELDRDYVVPPLEGLWWAGDMSSFTVRRDKAQWQWTLLLLVPEWLGESDFAAAVATVAAKGSAPDRLADVRLETLTEGRCVQTLHIGSFDDEAAVLARMHEEFLPAHQLQLDGRHHEIYLSDFRRVAPERRRTILRQPVRAEASSS